MNELISVAQLQSLVADDKAPLIFDCRFNLMDPDAGRQAYQEAHIPGAFYADLNKDLSSPHIAGESGRHPLPDKDAWIRQVQDWGISPDKQIVAYDDAGGAFAARLWWLLRWIGHEQVAVLDGGWQAWLAGGGDTNSGKEVERVASKADYAALPPLSREIPVEAIEGEKYLLLDAREKVRFSGEQEPIDPVAGHIPGAVCSPMSGNLDANGHFKSAAELRKKFSDLDQGNRELVCYCGSGVTATHNILALRIAGYDDPILYAGSWSEWITDPTRPVARGE